MFRTDFCGEPAGVPLPPPLAGHHGEDLPLQGAGHGAPGREQYYHTICITIFSIIFHNIQNL